MANAEDSTMSWNLLDEAWIPVVYMDGSHGEVGLRRLFGDAPRVREISGDCPQQTIVLIRLALAVLYRAYAGAASTEPDMLDLWMRIWRQGSLDDDVIEAYLDRLADRFGLFGERPFMQVAGLEARSGEVKPVTTLIPEVPKEDRFLFSLRAKGACTSLSLAEAARWLLFLQAFDIAGIKTLMKGVSDGGACQQKNSRVYAPTGVSGTGSLGSMLGVFLTGGNLFETLMLNWVLFDEARGEPLLGREGDLPAWELDGAPACGRSVHPEGPASLLGMRTRLARLVPDESGTRVVGVVSTYGDVPVLMDAQGCETMCSWRESEAQRKKLGLAWCPWMPVDVGEADVGRSLWRGLEPILAAGREPGADMRPGTVRWADTVCGELEDAGEDAPAIAVDAQGAIYGSQASVYMDFVADRVGLDAVMLRAGSPAVAQLLAVVSDTDAAVAELGRLAERLEMVAGSKHGGKAWRDDVQERAYTELDGLYRERIAGLSADVDASEYCARWRGEACRVLRRLSAELQRETGARQFGGRAEAAGTGRNAKKRLLTVAGAVSHFNRRLAETLGGTADTDVQTSVKRRGDE